MRRTSFAEFPCSLARGLDLIGDWWTPLIIRDVYIGLGRFEELVENLGVSRNLLTTRLKSLEENGIIERKAYQSRPLRHEYVLTQAGREFVPVILALTAWGDRWAQPSEGAPLLFQHTACGQVFNPEIRCSACGSSVSADEVRLLPGPGGRSARGTRLVADKLTKQTRD